MSICSELAEEVRRYGYEVIGVREDGSSCTIHFLHPTVRLERPVSYFASSIYYDKRSGKLEVTVRRRVPTYKELYLDYCYGDGEMVCRPHVWMEEKVLSVEARFRRDLLDRLRRLLSDMA